MTTLSCQSGAVGVLKKNKELVPSERKREDLRRRDCHPWEVTVVVYFKRLHRTKPPSYGDTNTRCVTFRHHFTSLCGVCLFVLFSFLSCNIPARDAAEIKKQNRRRPMPIARAKEVCALAALCSIQHLAAGFGATPPELRCRGVSFFFLLVQGGRRRFCSRIMSGVRTHQPIVSFSSQQSTIRYLGYVDRSFAMCTTHVLVRLKKPPPLICSSIATVHDLGRFPG